MNRRPLRRWITASLAVLCLLAPETALAAEGGLQIFPDLGQLVVLIALFTALVFPVNALLVKPLLGVLEERAERIEGARERASTLSQRAEESLERYRQDIDSARREAERERRGLLEAARVEQTDLTRSARSEAERRIEEARGEVGAALQQARTSLRADAETLARQAVERILGRSIS
ncbi:MAG: hypothetical protein ABFS46_08600 [Myxococcota bacterium]